MSAFDNKSKNLLILELYGSQTSENILHFLYLLGCILE